MKEVESRGVIRKIVRFVDSHGGIANVYPISLAKTLGCHSSTIYRDIARLKENNVLTQVVFNGNGKGDRCVLNTKMIEAGEHIVEYLLKFSAEEGAPINVSAFATNRKISVALMGITLDEFCKLGVVSVKPNNGSSPNYLLQEKDSSIWKGLWQPKLTFSDSDNDSIPNKDSLSIGEKLINFIKLKGGCIEEGTLALAESLNCTKSGVLLALDRLEKYKKIVIRQKTRKGDKYGKGIYALPNYIEKKEQVVETTSLEPLDVQLNKALKDKIQAQEQAIQFGKLLEQANMKIKELELKIVEIQTSGIRKENHELLTVADRNTNELKRLSLSVS